MAFVLKKSQAFQFQIEGDERIYEIPPFDQLNVDEIQALRNLQGTKDLKKSMLTFKSIFFDKIDGVKDLELSDVQILLIINAYEKDQGLKMGDAGDIQPGE